MPDNNVSNIEEIIECLESTIHNAEWANKIYTDCDIGFLKVMLALLKEYDEALKLMVYQYCTMAPLTISDEVFYNQYTSAGEAAFRLLGLKNGQSTDCVWKRWFPNG